MAFTYKLEHEDGTPADPRTFKTPCELATWRHDPARPGWSTPGHRHPARRRHGR
jgi:hypothetical protein